MSNAVHRSYYEDDIQNATPQRLRLMLIDGAIRFANKALSLWESDLPAAHLALGRCRNIIIELIASIRGDRESCEYIVDHIVRSAPLDAAARSAEVDNLEKISRQMLSVYLVVFRQLDEGQLSGEATKISDAIEILEVERETAKLICEQLPEAPQLSAPKGEDVTSAEAASVLGSSNDVAAPQGPATYGTIVTPPSATMSFEA